MSQLTSSQVITTSMDSPVGLLTLTAVEGKLRSLYMSDQRHAPVPSREWVRDDDAFGEIVGQLAAYFDGSLTAFDVPLAMEGTDFQLRVWKGLLEIPYGETMSYGELAQQVGSPGASRAVGLANGRNPIAIVVPCHRVIGANGSLTGYGGGLERKTWLLDHEASRVKGRLFAH